MEIRQRNKVVRHCARGIGLALAIAGPVALAQSVRTADEPKGRVAAAATTPAGALSNAAAAAAAAANAAAAAANAANAAAAAAAAAIEAINAVLPATQRVQSAARPPAGVDGARQAVAANPPSPSQKLPPAPETPAVQPAEPAPGPIVETPPVPEEQSLVALVGRYEVPVSVDARNDFAKGAAQPGAESEPAAAIAAINLTETIAAARGFSREVLVAAARAGQAQAQSGQALAALLPSASYQTKSGRETSSPSVALGLDGKPLTNDTHSRRDTGLTLRQPLVDLPNFLDWRRRGVIEEGRGESRRASEGDAYLSGVNAYLALVSSRLLGDLSREFEAQINDLLSYVEKRAAAGAASASDLARVRARSQAAISSRLEQEAAHAAAGTEYVRLTNLAPRTARLPELEDIGASMMPDSVDRAIEVAMAVNPEIAALTAEVRAAEIDKSAAKSRFLPRLDLEYTDNFSLHAGGDISSTGQRDKRTMLVMNWNFFSGGGDIKYGEERVHRHAELRYRLDDQRRRIVQALAAQYATLASTRERLTAGYRELRSITAAAEAMSKRMLSGNQSLLDLLDVYDRRYQARVRLVNLHVQEMGAVAQVVRLVRGLPGTPDPVARPSEIQPLKVPPTLKPAQASPVVPADDRQPPAENRARDAGAAAKPASADHAAPPPMPPEDPARRAGDTAAAGPIPDAAAGRSPASGATPAPADAGAAAPALQPPRSEPGTGVAPEQTQRLRAATNLNALARARYPGDLAARNEYRRLVALANPSLFGGRVRTGAVNLPAGTELVLPPGLAGIGGTQPTTSAAASGATGPAADGN